MTNPATLSTRRTMAPATAITREATHPTMPMVLLRATLMVLLRDLLLDTQTLRWTSTSLRLILRLRLSKIRPFFPLKLRVWFGTVSNSAHSGKTLEIFRFNIYYDPLEIVSLNYRLALVVVGLLSYVR
jgi:hypothetical protein